ncbi:hypothetical protein F8154_00135 [Alkaliphilus pronyensis]|uniref:S-layer homology domain-containing protein n=1 Tax=Alkaliphilus pronyensis TaxID=1482732 RepID=A0A6I0FET5_9FIRM|nr:YcdB/YcdC domain-containing protein [Alkaliphilus pronyensis]KAB3540965.1 hypothetical protein F8154_00135 [Alkaliphilus pronyensis]
MKFRKTLSFLLALGLILSSFSFVSAGETIVVEEAVEVKNVDVKDSEMTNPTNTNLTQENAEGIMKFYIKNLFDIVVDDGYQVNVEYRQDWRNPEKHVWSMHGHKYDRVSSMSIEVSIDDETGKLTSIYKWEHSRDSDNSVTQYTKEELQEVAYEFLKKVNGELLDKVELQEEPFFRHYYHGNGLRPRNYHYNYVRKENGIVVSNDGINIAVDSGTGKIAHYSYNWSDVDFPQLDDVISVEEAKEIYKKELDLKLSYLPVRLKHYYHDSQPQEIKLVYTPNLEGGQMIDALTGEIITYTGEAAKNKVTIDVTPKQKEEFKALEKKELTKELDKNQVTELVESLVKELLQQEGKVRSTRYTSSNQRKLWNIDFTLEDNDYMHGYVSVDAETGNILRFHYYDHMMYDKYRMDSESGEEIIPVISQEDAYKKAIDVMVELYPDKLKDLQTEMTLYDFEHAPEYHFNFSRVVNDIEYPYNSISVSFNKMTGQLQGIYMNWHDAEFPKAEGLLSKDEVLSKYMDDSTLELMFTQIYSHHIRYKAPTIKLVYMNKGKDNYWHFRNIDAVTGEYLDWNGESIKEKKSKEENISSILEGHEAEKELKIIIDTGIVDLENFQLDSTVPRKEIIKMLVNAMGFSPYMVEDAEDLKITNIDKEDDYYQYLQGAVMYDLLENEEKDLKLDETVTREEFAEMLMKMVGMENVAKAKDIFVVPVEDADEIQPDKKGFVAIVYGLDIVEAQENNYNPNAPVTLIDVAIGIYRTYKNFNVHNYYY